MIVCHCKAVSDRTIRKAVERGASTAREASLASNAGRGCGGCLRAVMQIVAEEKNGADESEALPTAAAS